MVFEGPAEVLHGRRVEREALERLFEAVRGWHPETDVPPTVKSGLPRV
jgi:hypothetical protein